MDLTTSPLPPQLPLGQTLRALRHARRLTLRAVETQAGISNSYLSQLEHGRIAHPAPPMLARLADVYQVSYADLLRDAGYLAPAPDPPGAVPADLTPAEARELATFLAYLRWKRTAGLDITSKPCYTTTK